MTASANKPIGTNIRAKESNLWKQTFSRLMHKKVAVISIVIITILYFSGTFAFLLAPDGYNDTNLAEVKQAPSLDHWLGTDRAGRDILSRIMFGLRTTVIITVASIATGGLFLGIFMGAIAGYAGNRIDAIIMRIGEVFLAFPGLLMVILIAATLKPRALDLARSFEDATGIDGIVQSGAVDYFVIFGSLAAFGWVGMARLVRGQILSLKEKEFVEAARAAGASSKRILFIHVLPNALAPVIVSVSMGMGSIAGSEVVLSWLGVGIQPPVPSLGRMIYENGSIGVLRSDPILILPPVAVIALLIFAFNLLGDALNDVLNPKTR